QAEPLLVRALATLPTEIVVRAGTTSRLLANVGALYVQTGRDAEAESAFKTSVRLLQEYANEDSHIIILLADLGSVHVRHGKYKQARKELEQALNQAQRRLKSDHRDFLPVL